MKITTCGMETKYGDQVSSFGDQVSRASWSTEEDIINNKILINESAFFYCFCTIIMNVNTYRASSWSIQYWIISI